MPEWYKQLKQYGRPITGCMILLLMLGNMALIGCKGIRHAENFNDTEIYERFLNDELAAEWKEKQLCISELFWDNDIEYCFLDIDGDGREELHIRDSSIYYLVDVKDKRPRIILEVQLINVNSKMRKIEIIFKAKKAHLPLGENIIFSKDIDSLDLQYFMRLCRI